MARRSPSSAAPDGSETARKLERAALTLLKKNGVLAGLNLREVADLAGINRGLVYHHFGSRGELLRSALRRDSDRRHAAYWPSEESVGFVGRIARMLRQSIKQAEQGRLAAILLLDGQTKIRMMPRREQTQRDLQFDQAEGRIPPDIDLVALHAFVQALSMGYVVSRNQLAAEFKIGVRDLDDRMIALVQRLITGSGDGPAADDSD
ncbi:TetR/AcrR family transcriptional regulator [Pseudonocardia sp. C8]|uniref:TetR/AcrR family transcriptional regulator n=1 Tax=Pseudonocardia sp. C8 TaxID=2762759 RepID=UPI001642D72D|nr:TetR/AcrR family transcriptional regulator [Pseudonocardia sp. C8]MBC3190428.1 TetR/AcrR family transcriptional regulator [Pseudonocardia sp. C8]